MTPSLSTILLAASAVCRSCRSTIGGLVGLVLGMFLAVGITRDAVTGNLAVQYAPADLAIAAVALLAAGTAAAMLFPTLVVFAALGWSAGALVATTIVLQDNLSPSYAVPLLAHALAAWVVAVTARWRSLQA